MNVLEAALVEIVRFLEEKTVPYMVVGGFASLHWGRPRLTRDLDFVVDVPEQELPAFVAHLGREFHGLRPDALEFIRRNHLVRLHTSSGVPADLMLAALPYLQSAIRRSVAVPVGPGNLRLITPEDLIVMKLASDRPVDHADVESVILRQSDRLDRAYLDRHVRDLAAGLERPEILTVYEACLRKAGKGG